MKKLHEKLRALLYEGTAEALAEACGRVRATQEPIAIDQVVKHLHAMGREAAAAEGNLAQGKVIVHYVEWDEDGDVAACTMCAGKEVFFSEEHKFGDYQMVYVPCPLCQPERAGGTLEISTGSQRNIYRAEIEDLLVQPLNLTARDEQALMSRCCYCGDWVIAGAVCDECALSQAECKVCVDEGTIECDVCMGVGTNEGFKCDGCGNRGCVPCYECEEEKL